MKRLLLTVGVCLTALLAGTDASRTQSGDRPPYYQDRNGRRAWDVFLVAGR